jgi:hypothetical protein
MLWELSVAEQRYRAALEARAGVPVTEVAERYGVSRQSVHTWLRYRQEGIAGLEDRSHQVHDHPWRIPAEVEEAICSCAVGIPKWGLRRPAFEMDRRGLAGSGNGRERAASRVRIHRRYRPPSLG